MCALELQEGSAKADNTNTTSLFCFSLADLWFYRKIEPTGESIKGEGRGRKEREDGRRWGKGRENKKLSHITIEAEKPPICSGRAADAVLTKV